jgi:hypothetical protein
VLHWYSLAGPQNIYIKLLTLSLFKAAKLSFLVVYKLERIFSKFFYDFLIFETTFSRIVTINHIAKPPIAIMFYHNYPHEWLNVPMPPFLMGML